MNRLKKLPLPLLSLLCAIVLTACAPQQPGETAAPAADSACVDTLLQERIEGDFLPYATLSANQNGYVLSLTDMITNDAKIRNGAFQVYYQLDRHFRLRWKNRLEAGCGPLMGGFSNYRDGYIGINPGCKRSIIRLDASGKITSEKPITLGAMQSDLMPVGNELVYFAITDGEWELTANQIRMPYFAVTYIRTDSLGNQLSEKALPGYRAELAKVQMPVLNGNHIAGICNNALLFYDLDGKPLGNYPITINGKQNALLSCHSFIPNNSGGLTFIGSYNSINRRKEAVFSYDSTGRQVFRFSPGENESPEKIIRLHDNNFLVAVQGETLMLYVISPSGQLVRKTDTGLRNIKFHACTETPDHHIAIMCSRKIRRYAQKIIFQEYDATGKKVCSE